MPIHTTSQHQTFLGDYNKLDAKAGKVVYTGLLPDHPPPTTGPGWVVPTPWQNDTAPDGEIRDWSPDPACAIVPPAEAGAAWPLLLPIAVVGWRRRWYASGVRILALLLALAALPVHAQAPACPGDCNGDGRVTINDLVTLVSIGLGEQPSSVCDDTGDVLECGPHGVFIICMTRAVNTALYGCPATPTPTP